MFSRYSSPYDVLNSYKTYQLIEFILRLIDKTREEQVERLYFVTERDISLYDFKRAYFKPLFKKSKSKVVKRMNEQQEKEQIEFAKQFIKER